MGRVLPDVSAGDGFSGFGEVVETSTFVGIGHSSNFKSRARTSEGRTPGWLLSGWHASAPFLGGRRVCDGSERANKSLAGELLGGKPADEALPRLTAAGCRLTLLPGSLEEAGALIPGLPDGVLWRLSKFRRTSLRSNRHPPLLLHARGKSIYRFCSNLPNYSQKSVLNSIGRGHFYATREFSEQSEEALTFIE